MTYDSSKHARKLKVKSDVTDANGDRKITYEDGSSQTIYAGRGRKMSDKYEGSHRKEK